MHQLHCCPKVELSGLKSASNFDNIYKSGMYSFIPSVYSSAASDGIYGLATPHFRRLWMRLSSTLLLPFSLLIPRRHRFCFRVSVLTHGRLPSQVTVTFRHTTSLDQASLGIPCYIYDISTVQDIRLHFEDAVLVDTNKFIPFLLDFKVRLHTRCRSY